MTLRQLLRAGGSIGLVILGLSMAMVALIVEHLLTIRRGSLMPDGLADSVAAMIATGRFAEADRLCREQPSFLGAVLAEGLAEAPLGYRAVEKTMEDSSAEQAARLFRKIEYLSVIGTLAPMLGLLGTVWGMIVAFQEFATKLNPPVSELAPGIYQALVTTLMGLGVAVPALAAFAIFRNRIDELVAEASLRAEHAWTSFKRASLGRGTTDGRRKTTSETAAGTASGSGTPRRVPPVAIERPEEPSE
jgi:biopolymer transport protein ExbB